MSQLIQTLSGVPVLEIIIIAALVVKAIYFDSQGNNIHVNSKEW